MSLETEIKKLTDAVVALTVVMRDAQESEWRKSPPGTPAPEAADDEPEAEAPPAATAPPPTLDQVRAAFRALAGRVGDVARNQTLTAELLRTHGGGEPPHLKNVPAENYAALIAAVEAAK